MDEPEKRGRGRPGRYDTDVKPRLAEIEEWMRAGATNREVAAALRLTVSVFQNYLNKYPELMDAVKRGRESGLPEIKKALYKRAVGFQYEERKGVQRRDEDGVVRTYTEITKRYALPDVAAIQIYLRNVSDEYRDKDSLTYEFKKKELELREKTIENEVF